MSTVKTLQPLWLGLILVSLGSFGFAVELQVPAEHLTIHEAVAAAEDGDEIVVAPGTYTIRAPIRFGGKAITLKSSAGPSRTTIRMGAPIDPQNASIIDFSGAETLRTVVDGFELRNGRGIMRDIPVLGAGPHGGAIFVGQHAEPTLSNLKITDCTALNGGGVFVGVDAAPSLESVSFHSCVGGYDSAAFGSAGALFVSPDSQVTAVGCGFFENRGGWGGAIRVQSQAQLTLNNCHVQENYARFGGALFGEGSITINESRFEKNGFSPEFTGVGGAIQFYQSSRDPASHLEVSNSVFEENEAFNGAAIYFKQARQPPVVSTISNCDFRHNRAMQQGGAVAVGYETGGVLIADSRFERNRAELGGAIHFRYESIATVRDCVLRGNIAEQGGAIWADDANLEFSQLTVAGNSAGLGGGLFLSTSRVLMWNSVVWGNAGGSVNALDLNPPRVVITFSCIESEIVQPGVGNTNSDPLFEAWPSSDVWIDPNAAADGNGTPDRPFRSLAAANRNYSLRVTADSPVVNGGTNGEHLGANVEIVDRVGFGSRTFHITEGEISTENESLALNVSIVGQGAGRSILEGTVWGLRSGQSLRDVSVRRGLPDGGVVVSQGEAPSISRCEIYQCHRALRCKESSAPVISDCYLHSNTASSGAAIRCDKNAKPVVERTKFYGNRGGVIRIRDGGEVSLTNCVMAGNSPGSPTVIPLINWAWDVVENPELAPASIVMTHCTIADNPRHVSLFNCAELEVTTRNCLFANNENIGVECGTGPGVVHSTSMAFLSKPLFDYSKTIDIDHERSMTTLPDFVRSDGEYHLTPNSEAIDRGPPVRDLNEDLVGRPRVCGFQADAGAYEFNSCTPAVFRRGLINRDDRSDLSDAVFLLDYLFTGGDRPSCLAAADVDDSDSLDISDAISLLLYLFLGNDEPPPPFSVCAEDPTNGSLSCLAPSGCE